MFAAASTTQQGVVAVNGNAAALKHHPQQRAFCGRGVAAMSAATSSSRIATLTRAAAESHTTSTTTNAHVEALMPPPGPSSAQLVAVVAAKSTPAPPPPAQEASPFVLFCRANWGYFAALQTVALIGATNNGILAKKRRLEIAEINEKLRAMMAKYEKVCDDPEEDGPASEALAKGKASLVASDWNAAAESFEEAKKIAAEAGNDAITVSAAKGTAQALAKAGQLRAAVAELETVTQLAVEQGDSSVYGALGDLHTDLAELQTAGAYYDKCLAMD